MPKNGKLSLTKILNSLFQKLKPQILQDQSRPSELPHASPDCGWNHGETKEK